MHLFLGGQETTVSAIHLCCVPRLTTSRNLEGGADTGGGGVEKKDIVLPEIGWRQGESRAH